MTAVTLGGTPTPYTRYGQGFRIILLAAQLHTPRLRISVTTAVALVEAACSWTRVPGRERAKGEPGNDRGCDNHQCAELDAFEQSPWGEKYPAVTDSWRRRWEEVIPFFAFSPEVRRIIYTTNAIESLHSQVRKAIRNKGHFPSDESATKLIYLALRNIEAKWKRPPKEWHSAKVQLAIQFGDRFTVAA